MKESFKNAANSITQFFRQHQLYEQAAYQQGQEEAYNELFQFALKKTNGDLKALSVKDLQNFLLEKIAQEDRPN